MVDLQQDSTSLDLKKEALRLAEARVQQQFTKSIAADQRAMAFAGFLVLAGTVSIGLDLSDNFSVLAFVAALIYFLGALFAVLSAGTKRYSLSGELYKNVVDSVGANLTEEQVVDVLGELHDRKIRNNIDQSVSCATKYTIAKILAALGTSILLVGGFTNTFPVASTDDSQIVSCEENAESNPVRFTADPATAEEEMTNEYCN